MLNRGPVLSASLHFTSIIPSLNSSSPNCLQKWWWWWWGGASSSHKHTDALSSSSLAAARSIVLKDWSSPLFPNFTFFNRFAFTSVLKLSGLGWNWMRFSGEQQLVTLPAVSARIYSRLLAPMLVCQQQAVSGCINHPALSLYLPNIQTTISV